LEVFGHLVEQSALLDAGRIVDFVPVGAHPFGPVKVAHALEAACAGAREVARVDVALDLDVFEEGEKERHARPVRGQVCVRIHTARGEAELPGFLLVAVVSDGRVAPGLWQRAPQ